MTKEKGLGGTQLRREIETCPCPVCRSDAAYVSRCMKDSK